LLRLVRFSTSDDPVNILFPNPPSGVELEVVYKEILQALFNITDDFEPVPCMSARVIDQVEAIPLH